MRTLIFIASLGLSYAWMRGWILSVDEGIRAALAAITLIFGLLLSYKLKNHDTPHFSSSRNACWIDFSAIGIGLLCITSFLTLLFTLGPAAGDRLTLKIGDFIEPDIQPDTESEATSENTTTDNSTKNIIPSHGNWLWDSRLSRELPKRTDYRPKNRPEVYLQATSPEQAKQLQASKLYIRAFTLAKFDGLRWTMHQPTKRILQPTNDIITLAPDAQWLDGLPIYQHKITHSYYHNGQNIFCGLHGAGETALPHLTKIAENIYLLPPKDASSWLYEYHVKSQPRIFDTIARHPLPLTPGSPTADLDPVYFETIPDHALRQKLQHWLGKTNRQHDLKAKLTSLREHLRLQCEYSLQVNNPNDLHPLDNFLFSEKRGSCEHFATITVMLCREMGIPSRIAFGWSGGKFFENSNLFVFRAADAHAWAEIYLKDYGWTVLDTTTEGESQTELAAIGEPTPTPEDELKEPEISPPLDPVTPPNSSISWKPLAWFLAATFLLGSIALWLRSKITNEKLASCHIFQNLEPTYITAFRKACAHRALPMRRSCTLRQQLKLLDKNNCKPDFADQIINYHYGVLYQGKKRMLEQEKLLLQLVQRWDSSRNHSS